MSAKKPRGPVNTLKGSQNTKKAVKKENLDPFQRELSEAVTTQTTVHEGLLNYIFSSSTFAKPLYKSKPGKIHNPQSNAYIQALNEAGVNNITVSNLFGINRGQMQRFYINPAMYMTIHNMLIVYALTGMSLDRQAQLLFFGLTRAEHKPHNRGPMKTFTHVHEENIIFNSGLPRPRASRPSCSKVDSSTGSKVDTSPGMVDTLQEDQHNEVMNSTGPISPGAKSGPAKVRKKRTTKKKVGRPKGAKNKPKPVTNSGAVITPDISSGLLDY
jgi:hypothetical protein